MSPVNQLRNTSINMAELLFPLAFKDAVKNGVGAETDDVSKVDLHMSSQYKIFVRDYNYQEKPVIISSLTTAKDLKAVLETKFGLPSNLQVLFDNKNQLQLDDSHTLSEYEVLEDFGVWMLGPLVKLIIKMPQVKAMLPLNVYNFKTIRDVKEAIGQSMGIPVEKQIVMHKGQPLSDGLTLKDYGIGMNTTLYALFRMKCATEGFKVIIGGASTKPFELKAKSSNTALDIKTVVESKTGLPVTLQVLYYGHNEIKNWKTLADYNVKERSVLNVVTFNTPTDIYITTSRGKIVSDTFLFKANTFDTVDDVLNKIPNKVESIAGHPSLFLDETRLVESKKLADYSIGSGSLLSLDRLIQITVTIPSGEMVIVDLKASYTVDEVEEKIEEICGIPWDLQILTYLNDELDEEYTLEDYEFHVGSLWALKWLCGGRSCSFYMPSYAA
ncbi:hypothetical protein IFM89_018052 [Coptis chinensis]|uniref:Ubiquitin-like domain-containing protein n=1 Tax=Coptis chinensis TaxID=261450 RepID=A0A835LWE4_9MAGN|nr:hypothetical protein IFM89_018052 [Coptis chinensis]